MAKDKPPDGTEPERTTPIGNRLSVQLTESGVIDWDRMRPDTRAKFERALGDRPQPGPTTIAAHEPAPPAVEPFPPGLAGTLYDSLSVLMMGLARRAGYTAEQAAVLQFSPGEKDALVPPTLAVLNKYGTNLGKYQEEIVLGVVFSTIISGKLALLRKPGTVIAMVPNTPPQPSQAENAAE